MQHENVDGKLAEFHAGVRLDLFCRFSSSSSCSSSEVDTRSWQ